MWEKKIIIWISVMIVLILAPSVSAGTQNNIWNNLTVYWTSDITTIANNATNSDVGAGTEVGNPTFTQSNNMVGSGYTAFDGNDAIHFDGSKMSYTPNYTAGCWVTNTETATIKELFSRGTFGAANTVQVWDDDRAGNDLFQVELWDAEGDKVEVTTPDAVLNGGHKNWVGVVINQTGGTLYLYLYINDTIVGSNSIASAISTTTADFYIGDDLVAGTGWTDNVDECLYINYSLTTDEISNIVNNGSVGKTLGPEVDTGPPTFSNDGLNNSLPKQNQTINIIFFNLSGWLLDV